MTVLSVLIPPIFSQFRSATGIFHVRHWDECSLESNQLRGWDEKERKLHNRPEQAKTRDDCSLSSCGAPHHASHSILNRLQQAGSTRGVVARDPFGRGCAGGAQRHGPVPSMSGDLTPSGSEAPVLRYQLLSTIDSKQNVEDGNPRPMGK